MTENPYDPPQQTRQRGNLRRLRINGFAQGARDGIVLSIPFIVIVAMVGVSYNQSILRIIQDVVVIPMIWAPIAGLVAEVKYRRKNPDITKRRWIFWEGETPSL